jgi:hypothetical protein
MMSKLEGFEANNSCMCFGLKGFDISWNFAFGIGKGA